MNEFATISNAERATRMRLGVTRLSSAQKSEIADAVARHHERANRESIVKSSGTIYARVDDVRRQLAVRLAIHIHNQVPLFTSSRGEIVYGVGGQEGVDRDAYSKSYGFPARWHNAGARFEGSDLIVEDSRGRERLRVKVPFSAYAALIHGELWTRPACLADDLYAIKSTAKTATRYAVRGGKIVKSGMALLCKNGEDRDYWEHGATLAECRTENAYKLSLYHAQEREKAATEALRARAERRNATIVRIAKRLATRGKLVVLTADARATGACLPGIESFCRAHGIPSDLCDGSLLVPLIGKDARVAMAMRNAAKRQYGLSA